MTPRLVIAFAALLASPYATAQNVLAPSGSCAGDIASYRTVQDSDVASGNLARSVYNQVKKEIAAAEAECAAGHDEQARADIIASRKRHGYATGL